MRYDPKMMPVLRVKFTLPDGEVLERNWNMEQATTDPAAAKLREAPPSWLENPRKAWDHPQDPITFTGTVKAGHEDEARTFCGAAPTKGQS